jgi:hypothetical protein
MTAAHECEAFTPSGDDDDPFCTACGHAACQDCDAAHSLMGYALCLPCLKAEGLEDPEEAVASEARYRQALVNLADNPSLADL